MRGNWMGISKKRKKPNVKWISKHTNIENVGFLCCIRMCSLKFQIAICDCNFWTPIWTPGHCRNWSFVWYSRIPKYMNSLKLHFFLCLLKIQVRPSTISLFSQPNCKRKQGHIFLLLSAQVGGKSFWKSDIKGRISNFYPMKNWRK